MMNRNLVATAVAVALFAAATQGAQAQQADGTAIDPVIVTATRTAITVDDALSSVSVITRADIE